MGKKVTLKDIAELSGLSVSTVSRALARTGKISAENEKKIFESAQKLNYPISIDDTPWELRDTLNIALVTHFYSGEFYSELFVGFDAATQNTKACLHLISVGNINSNPIELIAGLKKSNFDAAIIFLPDFHERDYRNLLKILPDNFPVVSAAPIVSPVLDTVTFDHYRGGHIVASHFITSGFKKVGIIQGPANKSEALLRKNGFVDLISETPGVSLTWSFKGDYSLAAGVSAYEHFKQSARKPEAIFCSNDDVAIGFMHSALRDGMRIPEDVAIAGFDDLPKCDYFKPTITSVRTPYDKLGQKVIELILDRIRSNDSVRHSGMTSLVPVTLSVRESTESRY